MGRIEADIALESWLLGFWPCSGQGQFTLTIKPRKETHQQPRTQPTLQCFATFAGVVGWCDPPPLGVSKRSVVELRRKDQQIALAEYSRLLILFLVLGQYLTQLWQVKGQIFAISMIFQLHESMASKLSIVAA